MSSNRFGELFRELRLRSGQTLRAFCMQNDFDTGNVSRMERGLAAAPEGDDLLERYAKALGITEHSDQWREFIDVAAASRGRLPSDLSADARLIEHMPVLFREIRKCRANGDAEVNALFALLAKA